MIPFHTLRVPLSKPSNYVVSFIQHSLSLKVPWFTVQMTLYSLSDIIFDGYYLTYKGSPTFSVLIKASLSLSLQSHPATYPGRGILS